MTSALLEARYEMLHEALRPDGVMTVVARAGLEDGAEPNVLEVAEAILPSRTETDEVVPRFERIAEAKTTMRAAASSVSGDVVELATNLGMIQSPDASLERLHQIEPARALFVVEGAGRYTPVVRRSVAASAIQGTASFPTHLYHIGSERPITKQKNGEENPEYKIAREIAGDHLPKDDTLTEFGLIYDSARQAGYLKLNDITVGGERLARVLAMPSVGVLNLVKIAHGNRGLPRGLDVVKRLDSVESRQLVVATNGQYRPKAEALAVEWAASGGYQMLPPVAIGDEPGYRVMHGGKEIVTGKREPFVYVSEAVALWRILSRMREANVF